MCFLWGNYALALVLDAIKLFPCGFVVVINLLCQNERDNGDGYCICKQGSCPRCSRAYRFHLMLNEPCFAGTTLSEFPLFPRSPILEMAAVLSPSQVGSAEEKKSPSRQPSSEPKKDSI